MQRIDTHIDRIIVEIEGQEYALAEKTVKVAEALVEARRKLRDAPEYKLWRAELKILIGKCALRRLFRSGEEENLDRMQRIHAGVLRAFEHNAELVERECMDAGETVFHRSDARTSEGR